MVSGLRELTRPKEQRLQVLTVLINLNSSITSKAILIIKLVQKKSTTLLRKLTKRRTGQHPTHISSIFIGNPRIICKSVPRLQNVHSLERS